MSTDALFFARTSEPLPGLNELDVVATVEPRVSDDGDAIPAGAEGTIVGIASGGAACVVEFGDPDGAMATVLASDLRLVQALAA